LSFYFYFGATFYNVLNIISQKFSFFGQVANSGFETRPIYKLFMVATNWVTFTGQSLRRI